MEISTFSAVIGTKACNGRCQFCVSRMTGFLEIANVRVNRPIHDNFGTACDLAELAGTTTVLFTGKGEPTLYPQQITTYLEALRGRKFPFKELQTNGLDIGRIASCGAPDGKLTVADLVAWRQLGLKTMCLSVTGVTREHNAATYHPDYPDLATTVAFLRHHGYSVRLSVMLVQGLVDTPALVAEVIEWCRAHRVTQLTVRPIRKPDTPEADETPAGRFVAERGLTPAQEQAVTQLVQLHRKPILTLSHGAAVYDVCGQNVCLTDCLNVPTEPNSIRTLIYYHNGRIAYHWQYPGAVLLDGDGDYED